LFLFQITYLSNDLFFNFSFYKTKYVRALHGNVENIKVPYSQTQFGVVLMIDVVGKQYPILKINK
jgi:hypothetical protein